MVRGRAPGFSLVEVIVALLLFTVALLGLAAVAAFAAASLNASLTQERAARQASALLDSLAFAAEPTTGERVIDGVAYRWTAAGAGAITVTALTARGHRFELSGRSVPVLPLRRP